MEKRVPGLGEIGQRPRGIDERDDLEVLAAGPELFRPRRPVVRDVDQEDSRVVGRDASGWPERNCDEVRGEPGREGGYRRADKVQDTSVHATTVDSSLSWCQDSVRTKIAWAEPA